MSSTHVSASRLFGGAARVAMLALGLALWVVAMLCLHGSAFIAGLGLRWWPDRTHSNCWTHALPLLSSRGGYLLVRWADDIRLFKRWRVPHCMWAPHLPDGMTVESYAPFRRVAAHWFPLHAVWFTGHIKTLDDSPQAARETS